MRKCPRCGSNNFIYSPLMVELKEKKKCGFILFIIAISLFVLSIAAIFAFWLLGECGNILISSENNLLSIDQIAEYSIKIIQWSIVKKILAFSGMVFIASGILYKLLPYEKVVRVQAVCQQCGVCLEMEEETYKLSKIKENENQLKQNR